MLKIAISSSRGFGILGLLLVAAGGYGAGHLLIAPMNRGSEAEAPPRLRMRLVDTVYAENGAPVQIQSIFSQLRKPAVIFMYRPMCSSCSTEFRTVVAVAHKNAFTLLL